jgi:uncharacterized membrane protein YdbT with pleckstrin-like domain
MPTAGTLVVLGIAVLICPALAAVNRVVPAEHREPHNEAIGFVHAVVNVIYAVILATVVVGLWNTEDEARTNTYTETDAGSSNAASAPSCSPADSYATTRNKPRAAKP